MSHRVTACSKRGVKRVKGMVRTLMLALEGRIQGDIPVHHPIMLWLVEHAAELVTKHLVGHDGKTAYTRLFGKPCRDEGFEFGERVHFRRGTARSASLDARWEDGIWLGRRWGGVTHIVAAVLRLPSAGTHPGSAGRPPRQRTPGV